MFSYTPSAQPDYQFLQGLTYYSILDFNYPSNLNRRQSVAIDTEGNPYYVEPSFSSGNHAKVRRAFYPNQKIAFVVKELYAFDKKAEKDAKKEMNHLKKAWGVCGYEVTKNKIRFFMPYFGQPLYDVLNKLSDDKQILEMTVKTLDQVIYWNKQGMTHGDLHLHNILVDGDRVRLVDAGLSCDFKEMTPGAWMPTSFHIAPELQDRIAADPNQDAFAVGQSLQPHFGFGEKLKLNKSILTPFYNEIGIALSRLDPNFKKRFKAF